MPYKIFFFLVMSNQMQPLCLQRKKIKGISDALLAPDFNDVFCISIGNRDFFVQVCCVCAIL